MGNGRSVKISARKNQEPWFLCIRLVCFPIQPKPASLAKALSKTGAESTKKFWPCIVEYYSNLETNALSLFLIVLW